MVCDAVLCKEILIYKFWMGAQSVAVKSGRKHDKNKKIGSILRVMYMSGGKALINKDILNGQRTRQGTVAMNESFKISPESTPVFIQLTVHPDEGVHSKPVFTPGVNRK